jgi:hypothetical protein
VREGLTDSSPLVRGWAAAVVAFVVCEYPERPLLRWRLTVGSPAFDGSSMLFRRRSEGAASAESRDALFHVVETLRLSSIPSLTRDRARVLLMAVRSVWSSPVLEQTAQVSYMGNQLVYRADAMGYLSTAWFVSSALAHASVKDPRLFSVSSGVMMLGGVDAPYGSEPFLRGVSRAELRAPLPVVPHELVARADLAVALAPSWHVPEPEFRFGMAHGRTDDHDMTAVAGLVEAVWALVPDPVLRPASAPLGGSSPGGAPL